MTRIVIGVAVFFLYPIAMADTLKIVDFNVWMGNTGRGKIQMPDFETKSQRTSRYEAQVEALKALAPDVLFLQELSPIRKRAYHIAEALGMDVILRGDNSGIRIGPVGLPLNLNMGVAIFAKKELNLIQVEVEPWRMSRGVLPGFPWGFANKWISFQLSERRVYLVGQIQWQGQELVLLNTHFHSDPDLSSVNLEIIQSLEQERSITSAEVQAIKTQMKHSDAIRDQGADFLIEVLKGESRPIIVAGDFNVHSDNKLIKKFIGAGYIDYTSGIPFTWEPDNPLVKCQETFNQTHLAPLNGVSRFMIQRDLVPRKLDYIFGRGFTPVMKVDKATRIDPVFNKLPLSDHHAVQVLLHYCQ